MVLKAKYLVKVLTVKKNNISNTFFFFTILIIYFVLKATKLIIKVIKTKEIYYLLVRLWLNGRRNMIYAHCQPHCYDGENPGLAQSKKKDPQSIHICVENLLLD